MTHETDADKVINPRHFGSDPAHNARHPEFRIRVQINPDIPNSQSLLADVRRRGGVLHSLGTV